MNCNSWEPQQTPSLYKKFSQPLILQPSGTNCLGSSLATDGVGGHDDISYLLPSICSTWSSYSGTAAPDKQRHYQSRPSLPDLNVDRLDELCEQLPWRHNWWRSSLPYRKFLWVAACLPSGICCWLLLSASLSHKDLL